MGLVFGVATMVWPIPAFGEKQPRETARQKRNAAPRSSGQFGSAAASENLTYSTGLIGLTFV